MQTVPVALTTLATLALFAGALLPLKTIVSDFNERIVPVTRRRLRPQSGAPTWPALLSEPIDAGSIEERTTAVHALVAGTPDARTGSVLAAVAREEEGELRLLALRSLIANRCPEGRDVFCEALRTGSDSERSLAVDGLARLNALDDLPEAFSDRLDAIAAKAALYFAASRERSHVIAALDDRVEPARRDAILKLLAGVLE